MKRTLIILALCLFALSCGDDTPKPPANNGWLGLEIGIPLRNYATVGAENVWIDAAFPFDKDSEEGKAVLDTIRAAIDDERKTAAFHKPQWTIPPSREYIVYFIKPNAQTENGLPAFYVQPFDSAGRPSGPKIKTAGTVLNVKRTIRPSAGGKYNPFIVLPYHENGWNLPYLYNSMVNESEHLTESWQSWEEWAFWSGPNDVHRHRASVVPQPTGLRSETVTHICGGAIDSGTEAMVIHRN